jgi:dihydroflavonol-4-reductase
MAGTALVTGGSGYIAGYLIRQLVAEGWTVHATIRDLANEATVRKLLAVDDARVRFFAADLTRDAGWAEAIAGCTHVAHVASPLPGRVLKDPDELIVPAREGVLRALRATKAAGIRRFVMTSSVAAIAYGRGRGVHTFTEADWTPPDYPGGSPYIRSKAIAERAARDWVAREGGDIEFCSVNPSVVLGPVWSRDFSSSIAVVKKLLDGSVRGCPDMGFGIVDVRDVAAMHVRLLEEPGMANERFIASGPFLKMIEIARILREKLGEEARQVPTRVLPDLLVRFGALFDPLVKAFVNELGSVRNMDASHAKAVLGWVPRPPEESIVDAARSLIDLGIVKYR